MAILITDKIPDQGFEIIENKLGAILLTELTNQMRLDCNQNELGVYIERQEPYDKAEGILVNVSLNGTTFTGHNEHDMQGANAFNIDVYFSGAETIDTTGSDIVRIELKKIVGWIRYILSSTKYKTLDLPLGLIMGTYVEQIQYDDNYGNQDGTFARMARISFNVRAIEDSESWAGVALNGNDTSIKIDVTDKGYKLTFNT